MDGPEQDHPPGGLAMRKANPFREELKVARSQRKRLQTIVDKLSDMSAE